MQRSKLYKPGFLLLTMAALTSPRISAEAQGSPAAAHAEAADEASRLQAATQADYRDMLSQLGILQVRPGASGDAKGPNPVNYDETRVTSYALPDPLRLSDGSPVTTARLWWSRRRPEIAAQLEDSMYGRMPVHLPGVSWSVLSTSTATVGGTEAVTQKLRGHVDNRADPSIVVDIEAELTLPAHPAGRVPVIIALDWPPQFWAEFARRTGHPLPQPSGPSAQEQVLARGWGYALLVPTSVQADNGAGLRSGIIGLCNHGGRRTPAQWGALRAWGWGAGKLLDYLATLPHVDGHRVGIFGHSRYGKAALVAMAFDPRFAIGYISSSGEAGAKLSRRNFGELPENVAAEGEYHWMAGNFLRYAGPLHADDLPVDAHDLIALCAPRPVFLSAGITQGDGWVDARGQFEAAVAASPVYRLLGKAGLGTTSFPPQGTEVGIGPLTFRQHGEGHTPAPNWPFFLRFAQRELAPVGPPAPPR